MDTFTLRQLVSQVLRKHSIDNLELEMELVSTFKGFLEKDLIKPSTEERKETLRLTVSAGAKEWEQKEMIIALIERNLKMNPHDRDGEAFVEYAFQRLKGYGEGTLDFIHWWKTMNPDPKYWSFKRMKQFWPLAFSDKPTADMLDQIDKWQGEFAPPPEKKL